MSLSRTLLHIIALQQTQLINPMCPWLKETNKEGLSYLSTFKQTAATHIELQTQHTLNSMLIMCAFHRSPENRLELFIEILSHINSNWWKHGHMCFRCKNTPRMCACCCTSVGVFKDLLVTVSFPCVCLYCATLHSKQTAKRINSDKNKG